MQNLVEVKSLTKHYVEKTGVTTEALRGIDLTLKKGDFATLAGPSGSGKTTLLNLIGALDAPTSGSIIFNGTEITNIPLKKLYQFRLKEIGFVFQAYNLFHQLTAQENIEYVLLLQGVSPKVRQAKAISLLSELNIADLRHKHPNQLSGGQQQRVAVARALATTPSLILADEPTANLDSVTAGELIELMHRLNREHKITFLFSTHDQLVMDKADTVYHLHDGKIQ
ncbi:MAG: ABC transporter ATP-binding protein [Candidatus Omnitrophica bacterium]|nr:ABC transporter ATP-binding protein [Candidatus Omnitrophota bacterium]